MHLEKNSQRDLILRSLDRTREIYNGYKGVLLDKKPDSLTVTGVRTQAGDMEPWQLNRDLLLAWLREGLDKEGLEWLAL